MSAPATRYSYYEYMLNFFIAGFYNTFIPERSKMARILLVRASRIPVAVELRGDQPKVVVYLDILDFENRFTPAPDVSLVMSYAFHAFACDLGLVDWTPPASIKMRMVGKTLLDVLLALDKIAFATGLRKVFEIAEEKGIAKEYVEYVFNPPLYRLILRMVERIARNASGPPSFVENVRFASYALAMWRTLDLLIFNAVAGGRVPDTFAGVVEAAMNRDIDGFVKNLEPVKELVSKTVLG